MRINSEGLELIKGFEGFETKAYLCPARVWTIGYGHIEGVSEGMTVTVQEAEQMLAKDLARFEAGVTKLVKVPLNTNEFSALVSFAFNIGLGAFESSTALRLLNAEDRTGAAEAMTWWNKGTIATKKVVLRGLTRRRAAEKALFLKPVGKHKPGKLYLTDLGLDNTRAAIVKENAPQRTDLRESRTLKATGAGSMATVVAGASTASSGAVGDLLVWVALGVVLIAFGWAAWARIDDWKKALR